MTKKIYLCFTHSYGKSDDMVEGFIAFKHRIQAEEWVRQKELEPPHLSASFREIELVTK